MTGGGEVMVVCSGGCQRRRVRDTEMDGRQGQALDGLEKRKYQAWPFGGLSAWPSRQESWLWWGRARGKGRAGHGSGQMTVMLGTGSDRWEEAQLAGGRQ